MGSPGGDGLRGKVRSIVYRGSVTHYYINSVGGPLLAYAQNAGAGDWAVGDDVCCAWDVEGGVLVAPERA
jgi:hypothetical protein